MLQHDRRQKGAVGLDILFAGGRLVAAIRQRADMARPVRPGVSVAGGVGLGIGQPVSTAVSYESANATWLVGK